MKNSYITRDEAVVVLYELINSCILSEEVNDNLNSIATCIDAEAKKNVFLWGAGEDAEDLFKSVICPYGSSEEFKTAENIERYGAWRKRTEELYDKYKIK